MSDDIDKAIEQTEPRPQFVHAAFTRDALAIEIKGLASWQLFAIIGTLQFHAEMMAVSETQRQQAGQIVVAPPGMKIKN